MGTKQLKLQVIFKRLSKKNLVKEAKKHFPGQQGNWKMLQPSSLGSRSDRIVCDAGDWWRCSWAVFTSLSTSFNPMWPWGVLLGSNVFSLQSTLEPQIFITYKIFKASFSSDATQKPARCKVALIWLWHRSKNLLLGYISTIFFLYFPWVCPLW